MSDSLQPHELQPTRLLCPWDSPGKNTGCCCWVTSVVSDSVWPHRWQPTRLPHPWDSPGKNTGVGCHFFLQCVKVKSESEVAQSCPTLSDPMDCSPPSSSTHGIFQARILEWVATAFSWGSSRPRDKTWVSHITGRFFTVWATPPLIFSISFSSSHTFPLYLNKSKLFPYLNHPCTKKCSILFLPPSTTTLLVLF